MLDPGGVRDSMGVGGYKALILSAMPKRSLLRLMRTGFAGSVSG